MPSIEAAVRARRVDGRRRLLVGLASLSVGTLLVGLGAAGALGTAASPKTGALVGGAAAVAGLVVLLVRAPAGERERAVDAVGAAVGLASLAGFWLLAPVDVVGRPTAATVASALGYCSGLAVVLASFLAAATSPARRRGPPAGPPRVAWTRSRPRDEARDPAADGGGTAGDDLSFPLDDD